MLTQQLTDDDIRIGDLVYVTHETIPLLGVVLQRTQPETVIGGGACVIAYLYRTETFGSYTGMSITIMNMKYVIKTGRNLFEWFDELPKPLERKPV